MGAPTYDTTRSFEFSVRATAGLQPEGASKQPPNEHTSLAHTASTCDSISRYVTSLPPAASQPASACIRQPLRSQQSTPGQQSKQGQQSNPGRQSRQGDARAHIRSSVSAKS